jgi:hypothetical protein
MKKLFVLLLSVMMIFSVAAVAMASTVTLSGYVRTGYDWIAGKDDGKAKIAMNAQINDNLSAVIKLEDGGLNGDTQFATVESSFTLTSGIATYKVGHFDYNVKDSVDILGGIFGGNDLDKIKTSILAKYNFTPKVFASLYLSQLTSNSSSVTLTSGTGISGTATSTVNQGYYGVSAGYAGDVFGIDAYYVTPEDSDWYFDPATVVNVYAKITPALKAYIHYGTTTYKPTAGDVDYKSEILGIAYYPTAPVYARFEYDFAKGIDGKADGHSMGFYTGYKFANGLEAQYCRQISTDTANHYVFDGNTGNYGTISRLRIIANF